MVVWEGSGGGTLKLTPVFRVVSVTLYLEEVEKGRIIQPGWVGWVGWVVMVASKPLCLANDDPEYMAVSEVWLVAGRRPVRVNIYLLRPEVRTALLVFGPRFRGSCHHAFLLSFCSSRDTPRVRHPNRYSLYPFRIRVPFGHTSTGNQLTAVGGGLVGGAGALVALSGGAVHRRPPSRGAKGPWYLPGRGHAF